MIGMGTQSHPSNSWDEAREGVPRSSHRRRTQRNPSAIVSSEFSPLRKVAVPRVELHPEFDGWREDTPCCVCKRAASAAGQKKSNGARVLPYTSRNFFRTLLKSAWS